MTAPLRSLLFVPGDSERKIAKSLGSGADAVIFDLEDSVAASRKRVAREMVGDHLRHDRTGLARWVRINPLSTADALPDLAAVVGGRPAGLLLPKADGPEDVRTLGLYLDALEAREGLPAGSIRILPITTETARAPLFLGQYADARLPRLLGLTWGAEDLSSALGAAANTDGDGRLSLTYRMVRSLMLLAAKAAALEAIDAVYPDYRDVEGLRQTSKASQREGFTGRLAVHPDQVEAINEAFTPGAEDIAFAERVIAAFDAAPETGVVGLDGRMLDRPHLLQAAKVLAIRDALAGRRGAD